MPLILLLFLFLPPTSLAQISLFSSSKDKDVTIDRAEFGFSGTVPPEAWTPITVWITGGQHGFSGALVLEFQQDDTQPARIIVPAAATPGVSIPVEAVACLPAGLESVSITMVDQNLRPKAKATYTRYPDRNQRQLVADTVQDQGLVLCVGRTSAARAFATPRFISFQQTEDGGPVLSSIPTPPTPPDLTIAAVDSPRLPLSWAAYSGVEAVILDADLSPPPDPRAIEALHTWVSGGGRLIVVANSPGNLWRRWFPPGPFGDLVDLQEVARHTTPIDLGDAVHAAAPLRRADGVYAVDVARRDPLLEPAVFDTPAAPSASGRLIRSTPSARAQGWTTRWSPPDSQGSGLLAEGPVGFGWVTVVGTDPEFAAAAPTHDTSAAVWGDVIRLVLADWLERTKPDASVQAQYQFQYGLGGFYSRSAPDHESQAALTGALNSISTVRPVGRGVFWAIAICLAALALLVGPFDAFVLKRLKLRQLSWLTALTWIGLASAGAYFVPGAIRSGRTMLNRVCVIDVTNAREKNLTSTTAWQTGITGIFASGRGEMELQGASPLSWWRGVSSRPWSRWERVRTTPFRALTTVQSSSEGARTNIPTSVWQGQWTFRMFQDDGPLNSHPNARVTKGADGYQVRVDGIALDASIAKAALRIGDRWLRLVDQSAPSATVAPPSQAMTESARSSDSPTSPSVRASKQVLLRTSGAAMPSEWDKRDRPAQDAARIIVFPDSPTSAFGLAGPRQRSAAIELQLSAGGCAAVYLHITGGPPSPGLNVPADYGQETLMRILVPLAPPEPADAAENSSIQDPGKAP